MKCEQAMEMLADALGHELTNADRASLDDHLRSCDACHSEFASLTATLGALRRLETVPPQASLPMTKPSASLAPARFRLFAGLARYAAVVGLAFAAGFVARGGTGGNSGTQRPPKPDAPLVGPGDGSDMTTRAALASAHRLNPHANQLAKLMMALHPREKS